MKLRGGNESMAQSDKVIYVVDSSSWISIEGNPAENKILFHLSVLIERNQIKCPTQVWNELQRCERVMAWIEPQRKSIVQNFRRQPKFLQTLGQVTMKFPAMSGARGRRNKAEPYVVAHAAYIIENENPSKCSVVCDETLTSRPNRKLPTACKAFGVEPLTLMEMLAREFPEENWS
jgi:hypothetical protein